MSVPPGSLFEHKLQTSTKVRAFRLARKRERSEMGERMVDPGVCQLLAPLSHAVGESKGSPAVGRIAATSARRSRFKGPQTAQRDPAAPEGQRLTRLIRSDSAA